jgi:hypothetical protein
MIRRHVVGRRSLLLGAASIGALAASSARLAAQSSDVPAAAPLPPRGVAWAKI